jgi:hypothetical protein
MAGVGAAARRTGPALRRSISPQQMPHVALLWRARDARALFPGILHGAVPTGTPRQTTFTYVWNDGLSKGGDVEDILLREILNKARAGEEMYAAKDRRIATLREFQLMVDAAKAAYEDGLVEALFQTPSRGKISGGLIRAFTLVGITPAGAERLAQLQQG